jgi:hypothetical protein
MIIGFAGKAAAGKTTAARCMVEHLQGDVRIIPMAQVLRSEVEIFLRAAGAKEYVPLVYGCQNDKVRLFSVDTQQANRACPLWSHFVAEHADIQKNSEQTVVSVRRILQWWGTEYRRAEDPDYWTKAWATLVENLDLNTLHVLIDDVRFMNELSTIQNEGGLIVKIERPGFNGAGNHASETALDNYADWYRVIINDGSLSDFEQKISDLTTELHVANGK